jgi:hypothetical protein
MGIRKPSRHSRNRKRWRKCECLVCFLMFGSFGTLFLCGTNSDSDDRPGHATVVSVTPVGRSSAKCGFPARWCTPHIGLVLSENFLTCIFLGAALGVMNQFRGLRSHPILCRFISSCGDTFRTSLQGPCDPPRWTEAQNCCCDWNSYTANAREHLEGNWVPLGHLTYKERRAHWSCLAFCSIDSISNKTFWVTLSYSISIFFIIISDLKIIGHGNPDNNLESLCKFHRTVQLLYLKHFRI